MRQFNERVVLQAIRLHGSCPKADIARLTQPDGADRLADHHPAARSDGLLLQARAAARQGRPALGADGAEPGRRLLHRHQDRPAQHGHAAGRLHRPGARARCRWTTRSPTRTRCSTRSRRSCKTLCARPAAAAARRGCSGVGIAAPLSLGGWQTLLGIAPEQAAKWDRHRHPRARAGDDRSAGRVRQGHRRPPAWPSWWPGAGAACAASCTSSSTPSSAAAWCIDSHLHGGLQRQRRRGRLDAARPGASGDASAPPQLLSVASLFNLERCLPRAGLDARRPPTTRALAGALAGHTAAWLRDAAPRDRAGDQQRRLPARPRRRDHRRLVRPRAARRSCCAAVEQALDRYSWEGVARPVAAGRHDRLRRARHRRRAAAAVRQLRARPRPVPQEPLAFPI